MTPEYSYLISQYVERLKDVLGEINDEARRACLHCSVQVFLDPADGYITYTLMQGDDVIASYNSITDK